MHSLHERGRSPWKYNMEPLSQLRRIAQLTLLLILFYLFYFIPHHLATLHLLPAFFVGDIGLSFLPVCLAKEDSLPICCFIASTLENCLWLLFVHLNCLQRGGTLLCSEILTSIMWAFTSSLYLLALTFWALTQGISCNVTFSQPFLPPWEPVPLVPWKALACFPFLLSPSLKHFLPSDMGYFLHSLKKKESW